MLNQRKKRSPLFFVGSVLLGVVIFALILFAVFNFWVNQNCFLVEVSGDRSEEHTSELQSQR